MSWLENARKNGCRKHTISELRQLWWEFEDVPISESDESDADFYMWEKGTDRMYIWHWFDEQWPNGVYDLIYGGADRESTSAVD